MRNFVKEMKDDPKYKSSLSEPLNNLVMQLLLPLVFQRFLGFECNYYKEMGLFYNRRLIFRIKSIYFFIDRFLLQVSTILFNRL